MGEIKNEIKETSQEHGFNNIKSEMKMTLNDAANFVKSLFKERVENKSGIPDKFYSTEEQRIDHLPQDGRWIGEIGNSKFIPNDKEVMNELGKYGLNGIEYRKYCPDFSKCAFYTAKIDHMEPDKEKNAIKYYDKLCEQGYFNTSREAKDFKSSNNFRFHECSDTRTCQMVPKIIHESFTHCGGRFECSIRDNINKGGSKFDE